jgi:hypothetical protein
MVPDDFMFKDHDVSAYLPGVDMSATVGSHAVVVARFNYSTFDWLTKLGCQACN